MVFKGTRAFGSISILTSNFNFTSYQITSHSIPGAIDLIAPCLSKDIFPSSIKEVQQMVCRGEIHLRNRINVIVSAIILQYVLKDNYKNLPTSCLSNNSERVFFFYRNVL